MKLSIYLQKFKKAFDVAGIEIILSFLGICFLIFNLFFSFEFEDKSLPTVVNFTLMLHPLIIAIRQFIRAQFHDEVPLIILYFQALHGELDEDDLREKCQVWASLIVIITAVICQVILLTVAQNEASQRILESM